MGRNIFRQETQIRPSDTYDDSIAPTLAAYETNPANIEENLNHLRSAVQNILNRSGAGFPSGNWYDDMTAPTALETGSKRGVDALNAAIHAVEKKRVLRDVSDPGNDVTVGASANYVILAVGELPTNTTAAVGVVTTLGTVIAFHAGTFGTHSLDEVSAGNNLEPRNLCEIVDASSGDPILSSSRRIWGLLQCETNTDGQTLTGTTPNRAQISFVRPNATFDDLEACPAADIQGKTINYSTRERVRLEDLNEYDFLRGAIVDVGAGAGTIDRQTAYNNQGVTPVDVVTNSILDLEGAGLEWQIRDDLEAILFRVIEGSAGGTSKVAVEDDVDEFDVDAVVSDFLNGIKVDTGAAGTTINIGVTANQIDSGGALTVASAAATVLKLAAGGALRFTDTNEPAGWSLDGIALSDAAAEWTDFEAEFGEVSILNAILQASKAGGIRKVHATCTTKVNAGNDISGPSDDNNIDTDLGDISAGDFVQDYDFYVNGGYQRPHASAATHDIYPGTSRANGQVKLSYKLKVGDELAMFDRAA